MQANHQAQAEFRGFLLSLGLTESAVQAVLRRNADYESMMVDMATCALFYGVPADELPSAIAQYFALDNLSHEEDITREDIERATGILAQYVLGVHAETSAGIHNKDVQALANKVFEVAARSEVAARYRYALALNGNGHQRKALHDLIFRFNVTKTKLRAAGETIGGCMTVFTPTISAHMSRWIPYLPRLLQHVALLDE